MSGYVTVKEFWDLSFYEIYSVIEGKKRDQELQMHVGRRIGAWVNNSLGGRASFRDLCPLPTIDGKPISDRINKELLAKRKAQMIKAWK